MVHVPSEHDDFQDQFIKMNFTDEDGDPLDVRDLKDGESITGTLSKNFIQLFAGIRLPLLVPE